MDNHEKLVCSVVKDGTGRPKCTYANGRDYNETVLLSRLQAVKIDMGSNQETSGTQAGFEGFTADKLARDLIEVLERKIKKCKSHREREVLRYAQHLLQCNGCEKDRLVIEIGISRKC